MSNFLNFAGNSGVTFKSFTASGGTTYTLDVSSSTNSLMVSIGGVLQKPSTDYTVSGTTLTTTDTIASGIVIDTYVIHSAGGTTPIIEDNSVTTAKILNNNVTGAKIAMGSDAAGDILYYNGTDYVRLGKGTTGHYLSQGGSNAPAWAAVSAGFTHATPQAGSGTSMTFGSIPTGTSFIVVTMHDFSSSGADEWMVQIGDSGGIETADYRSQRSANTNGSIASDGTPNSNESKGFGITVDAAGNAFGGQMILSLHHPTNHTWTSSSSFRRDGFDHSWGAGSKDLSAELTQVRITTKGGSESFDAGTINIMYM